MSHEELCGCRHLTIAQLIDIAYIILLLVYMTFMLCFFSKIARTVHVRCNKCSSK